MQKSLKSFPHIKGQPKFIHTNQTFYFSFEENCREIVNYGLPPRRNPHLKKFNTLTANSEYSCSNGENLPLPIQMQLSEKSKQICQFFIACLEFTLNFEHFEKNEPHSISFSEVIDFERRAYLNA